ncbi:hypothetical protein B0D78_05885 [Pyramidobacter sp. C12-8]|nr:hypothetical protein B0D78_05885 [Pyramidobacter sp. C12-8]
MISVMKRLCNVFHRERSTGNVREQAFGVKSNFQHRRSNDFPRQYWFFIGRSNSKALRRNFTKRTAQPALRLSRAEFGELSLSSQAKKIKKTAEFYNTIF